MKKAEKIILKLIVWFVPPFLFFILFWWIAASINHFQIITIPDNIIAIIAFTGLLSGFIFVVITYKYFFKEFYNFPYWFLILLYIFMSSIAFALMMGIPVCVFILGIVAGIYIGRKSHYSGKKQNSLFKFSSLFTSIITGFWTFFSCILALTDRDIINLIKRVSGFSDNIILGPFGYIIIILVTLIFGYIQFNLTLFICTLSYNIKLK